MEPIRLTSPSDVLALLPYQLGYHPHDAVVVVTVHGRTVGLVERIDIPPPQHMVEAADAMVGPLLSDLPDAAVLVGYESTPGASLPLLDQLRSGCRLAGIEVLDRVVVRDGRWYSPDCRDGCCPGDGRPVEEPAAHPGVAELVAMGVSPLPSRAALAGVVTADPVIAPVVARALSRRRAAGLRPATGPHGSVDDRRAWLVQWGEAVDVAEEAPEVQDTSPATVAELVLSLQDVELRDGLIARWCPDTLPLEALGAPLAHQLRTLLPDPAWAVGEEAPAAGRRVLARLQWLARAVPDEDAAPVLTVLASLAWWLGDGAVAREALDRALDARPDYRLARLLERMVDLGVRSRSDRPPGRGLATPA
ncbi:DUF4192 domain-containing protein [Pedococcus sp. NPDC057267]|uniref:DUF4192 domain-containing protein n=1 Tax=Pedococcus sp. NPDC057267 TaxID=3346077 RepID=UPI0036326D18